MKRFCDKKIIITGGCRGIGRSIAEKFLKEGAKVAVTYNKSEDAVKLMQYELEEYREQLNFYKMDVCDNWQVKEVMTDIQEKFGGIDILINNAGIVKDSLMYCMDDNDWDQVIKTNLYGCFYTSKSVLYNMIRQKKGIIINMASVSGIVGIAGQANYCASKFGIIGLTKTMAKELLKKNIRVNAVAPGYVDTEMISNINMKNVKVATPEEIAHIVMFLSSEESSYINGQVIIADGGSI